MTKNGIFKYGCEMYSLSKKENKKKPTQLACILRFVETSDSVCLVIIMKLTSATPSVCIHLIFVRKK